MNTRPVCRFFWGGGLLVTHFEINDIHRNVIVLRMNVCEMIVVAIIAPRSNYNINFNLKLFPSPILILAKA